MDFPANPEGPSDTTPCAAAQESVRVLDNINLEIAEGEIVGIIGRSGCGKTVLIHLVRGIDQPPTSGQIIYHVAVCTRCGRSCRPGHAGTSCSDDGAVLEAVDVAFWEPET